MEERENPEKEIDCLWKGGLWGESELLILVGGVGWLRAEGAARGAVVRYPVLIVVGV